MPDARTPHEFPHEPDSPEHVPDDKDDAYHAADAQQVGSAGAVYDIESYRNGTTPASKTSCCMKLRRSP